MKKHLAPVGFLAVYILFFALLFLQYPLSGSLVGNTDAIGTLAIYKEHLLKLKFLFLNQPSGNIFYPEPGLTSFCEPYAGETFFYFIFNLLGISDFYIVYLLIVVFYALNSFAIYCLARHYTKNWWAAFCAGLAFSCSCYMLCNQEMMNALVLFPAIFALLYLERFIEDKRGANLLWCVFFIALQFYFSTYNFVYAGLLAVAFGLPHIKFLLQDLKTRPLFYAGVSVFLAMLVAPMVYFIVLSGNFKNVYNPLVELPGVTERYSFTLNNFLASYPTNPIYSGGVSIFGNLSLQNEYFANIGVAFWAVALLALLKPFKYRWVLFSTLVFSVLISFGTHLNILGFKVAMPLAFIYKWEFWKVFYRIPGRTFVVGVFAASLLFAQGLSYISVNIKRGNILAGVLTACVLLENIPVPFPMVHNCEALIPPKGYLEFLQDKRMKVTAELPSSLFTGRFQYVNDISEYSREYRYMYWQTIHRNYTINGSGSFFPQSRMRNNDLMKDITRGDNLEQLIKINKLDYITFHKKFVFAEEEKGVGAFLAGSLLLQKQLENDEIIVYSIKPVKN